MNAFQTQFGFGHIVPPQLDEVKTYFDEKGVPTVEAEVFYYYFQGLNWHRENGMPVRNWKTAANEWLWNLEN